VTGATIVYLHGMAGGHLERDGRKVWLNASSLVRGTVAGELSGALNPAGHIKLFHRPAAIYSLHAARGPTLVYNGLEDTTVAIPRFGEEYFRELQERVAKMRGKREGVFDAMFHPGAGHRPYFVTKTVALWLEKYLDFPNWTNEDIEAMPVTHISEWARANSVDMDPLYATEHREGGTAGLGTGIPGVKRSDLDVFNDDEWQERLPMLVHENWRERAKELIAP
jgi:hypothetical protein